MEEKRPVETRIKANPRPTAPKTGSMGTNLKAAINAITINKPYPAPDADVKKMTERAGCNELKPSAKGLGQPSGVVGWCHPR